MQGCICPHPPLLIPEVGGAARGKIAATVTAMEKLAGSVGEPETVVVISPHADDFGVPHAVKTAPRLRGDFGRFRCPEAAFSYDNDVQFAELLLRSGRGLPQASRRCPTTATCSTGACSCR